MRTRRNAWFLALGGWLLASTAGTAGAAPASIGFIAAVQGKVKVERGGAALAARVALELRMGDVISTAVGARAKLLFGDGSVLNVGDDTRLRITRFVYDPARDTFGLFEVLRGIIRSWVSKLRAQSSFEVRAGTAVAGVRGTDFVVRLVGKVAEVVVFSGEVRVRSTLPGVGGECVARAGMMCRVLRGKAPGKPRPTPGRLQRTLKRGTRLASLLRHDGRRLAEAVQDRLRRLPSLTDLPRTVRKAGEAAKAVTRDAARDAAREVVRDLAEHYRGREAKSLPGQGAALLDTVLPARLLRLRVEARLAGRY